MTASITGTIIQGEQSIENNSTEVTVVLTVSWDGGSWAGDNPPGSITIDGETKTFTKNFNSSKKNSGSEELYRWTKIVYHNDDGTKTVECSGYSQVNRKGEGTSYYEYWEGEKVLTKIARADTLGEIEDFNIHDKITIPFTKVSTATTSTLVVKYGSTQIYSCPHTEIKNGLPDSAKLAFYKAIGNSVMSGEVTFTLTTYYNGTAIGTSVQTATVSRNNYDRIGTLSAFDIEDGLNVPVTINKHSTMTNKLVVKHGSNTFYEKTNAVSKNEVAFSNDVILQVYNSIKSMSGTLTVTLETFYQGYSVGITSKDVAVTIAKPDTLGTIIGFNIHNKFYIPFTKVSSLTTSTLVMKYGSTQFYSCKHTEIPNELPDSARLAFYKAIGNSTMSGKVTFVLTTYYNGVVVGTSTKTATVSRNKYDEIGTLSAFDIEKSLNVPVTVNRHSTMTNKLLVKHGDLVLSELSNVNAKNEIVFGNKLVLKFYNAVSGTSGAVTVSLETFYQGYSVGKVSKNVTVNIGGTIDYKNGSYKKSLVWIKVKGKWVKCLAFVKDGSWRRGR